MVTPYDWQEGMGHRAQFVESRLKAGIPVFAVSIPEGILIATYRTQSTKIFEIYDNLIYSAIGLQSDVESLRIASVEYCHQEGFRRSEDDVTINRVVTRMGAPLKQAFADFQTSPIVVRSVFAEVNADIKKDCYMVLDYDGDFSMCRESGIVAGSKDAHDAMVKAVEGVDFPTANTEDALAQLREAVLKGMDPTGEQAAQSNLPELTFEAALIRRDDKRTRRFVRIEGDGNQNGH